MEANNAGGALEHVTMTSMMKSRSAVALGRAAEGKTGGQKRKGGGETEENRRVLRRGKAESSFVASNNLQDICGICGISRGATQGTEAYDQSILFKYDVFLNHRGPDVKKTFVSHLDAALRRAGCEPFLDAKSLKKGHHAFNSIFEALTGVHVHVAIFSSRYAESKYCLNELCDMLESRKPLIPVFYDVQPENLRWTEDGPFAEAFCKHSKKGRNEDIVRWKTALLKVADITGFKLVDCDNDTAKLEGKVVAAVLDNLPAPSPMPSARHPVGLKESSMHIIHILHNMGENVGVVGIGGMGGIGKTTLAREVFNQEQSKFYSQCFLKDVKDTKGVAFMDNLQMKMVTDLLHVDSKKMHWNSARWFEKIKNQKVLLVIDGIDQRKQFDGLIPDLKELVPGSRVIITSREKDVLTSIISDAPQSALYEVPELNFSNSLDLFIWCAFQMKGLDAIDISFHYFVEEITRACSGLPLALEVMGGLLSDKTNFPDDEEYWKDASLELRRNGEIITSLRLSYDGLANMEDKNMFLEIACFMLGHPKSVAIEVWNSIGYYESPIWSLIKLINKCLIKIEDGKLNMHDLIRDMGRNIIMERRGYYKPEMQSYIWDPSMAAKILQKKQASSLNEILAFSTIGVDHCISCKAESYAVMKEMRYILLDGCQIHGDFSGWSEELRWLQWRYYFHEELPWTLKLPNLAVLDLTNSSNLTYIWRKDFELKFPCEELRMLILSNCTKLQELPRHINKLIKLKYLDLKGCESLSSLPSSLGGLKELQYLNLEKCHNLRALFENFGCLENLQKLNLNYCRNLIRLPESFSNLSNLEDLSLDGCMRLQKLPLPIYRIKKLKMLSMRATEELLEGFDQLQKLMLPDTFLNLSNLEELNLSNSSVLQMLPPSICGLKKLKVFCIEGTALKQLPKDFGQLQSLKEANLSFCGSLTELPYSFSNLSNLESLSLHMCKQLEVLPPLYELKKLTILRMGHLALEDLPMGFEQLHSLVEVDLSFCQSLKELTNSFSNMSNLVKLDMSRCSLLQMLPPSICGLKKLKTLCMVGTALQELPEDFGQLQSLQHVNFSFCGSLTRLPDSFSELCNLEDLNLDKCSLLQELPPSISGLKKLRFLRMVGIAVGKLPRDFGLLRNLVSANLSSCESLRELPDPISYLSNLEDLILDRCKRLEEIPPSICSLKKLKVLGLGKTALKDLPKDFGQLQSLEDLNLDKCKQLRKLPSFRGLQELRVLYLGKTALKELPEDFGQLQSLTEADLNKCRELENLCDDFGCLRSLQKLNLENCGRLTKLPEAFSELSNLEYLNLSGCRMLQMLPPFLHGLTKLTTLDLTSLTWDKAPDQVQFWKLSCKPKIERGGLERLRDLCPPGLLQDYFVGRLSELEAYDQYLADFTRDFVRDPDWRLFGTDVYVPHRLADDDGDFQVDLWGWSSTLGNNTTRHSLDTEWRFPSLPNYLFLDVEPNV